MNELNGFLDGLKRGKGCEWGHQTRIVHDGFESRLNDMKEYLDEYRKKMDFLIYLVIALAFLMGGDVVAKLLPALLR